MQVQQNTTSNTGGQVTGLSGCRASGGGFPSPFGVLVEVEVTGDPCDVCAATLDDGGCQIYRLGLMHAVELHFGGDCSERGVAYMVEPAVELPVEPGAEVRPCLTCGGPGCPCAAEG